MATIKFHLDKKYLKKDMTLPVKIRFSTKNTYCELTPLFFIKENEWNPKENVVVGSSFSAMYNRVLELKRLQINAFVCDCKMKGIDFINPVQMRDMFEKYINAFENISDVEKSFEKPVRKSELSNNSPQAYIDSRFAPVEFEKYVKYFFEKNTIKQRTVEIYEQTAIKIKKYSPGLKYLQEIDYSWLKGFESFLLKKEKNAINTANIHFRNIRAWYNFAINEKLVSADDYPFHQFSIKQEQTAHRNFSVEEIKSIRDRHIEAHQEKYRDIFMLIFYLIGINITDLCNLKLLSSSGRIEYRRAKTGRLYSIKIEPEAMAIIEKYKGVDYLLDILDRYKNVGDYMRRLNRALKDIYPENKDITTYWARHSWASIAASLDVPKETIGAALGHSDKSVTNIYINFNEKKIDEANRKVIDYLNNYKNE